MNKILKKVLPLLIVAPLFMANSPMPYQPPQEYVDFDMTHITCTKNNENEYYTYNIGLLNYGSKYMLLDNIYYDDGSNYFALENPTNVYDNQCLAPNREIDIEGNCEKDYTDADIQLRASAITVEAEVTGFTVTFDNASDIREYNGRQYSFYYFNTKGIKHKSGYTYSSIVVVNIKGQEFTYYSTPDPSKSISFMYEPNISPEDFYVEHIYLVQGRQKNYTGSIIMGGILAALLGSAGMAVLIVIAGVLGFTIFVVAPLVVLLAIRPWKKRKVEEPKPEDEKNSN